MVTRVTLDMKPCHCRAVFLTVVILAAVLVADIVNRLKTDPGVGGGTDRTVKKIDTSYNEKIHQNGWTVPTVYQERPSSNILGTDFKNDLLWFIQISDLHISIFQDQQRIKDFEHFCEETLDTIKPVVVVASGDLTDAKIDSTKSAQVVKEWKIYHSILDKTNVRGKTVWLDVRGNHDAFDVPHQNSSKNLFKKYSVRGKEHPRSYKHTIKVGGKLYSFVAVDACLDPGPRRPFNFIGQITVSEMAHLLRLEEQTRHHDYRVWFGHFPTSAVISPPPGIRDLMSSGLAYLCGHLHTLGGYVPRMYTRHKTGLLELELADWKWMRMYRVVVIDNGLVSFVDIKHDSWPVVAVTNPKNALFFTPDNEPLWKIKLSTHIRVLAFSPSPIKEVKIRLDDGPWQECTHAGGHLYTVKWDPSAFSSGLYHIESEARDMLGRQTTSSHFFSLDGSRPDFALSSRFVLMLDISSVLQFGFLLLLLVTMAVPTYLRINHRRVVLEGKLHMQQTNPLSARVLVRKVWIMSTVNSLYWPQVALLVYMALGPWVIGEVLEGQLGAIFVWGTYVDGSWLPTYLTYGFGIVELVVFNVPLLLAVAHVTDIRFQEIYQSRRSSWYSFSRILKHVFVVIPVGLNLRLLNTFWVCYGGIGGLVGPLLPGSTLFGLILWRRACRLSRSDLRQAAKVWWKAASR